MRTLPKILAACAAMALAGSAAWAATIPPMHHLTLALPGGGVEHIAYSGDVAPQVTILPQAVAMTAAPAWFTPMGFDAMTGRIDRIVAAMGTDMDAMLRQAGAMMAMPAFNGIMHANLGRLPQGGESYSVISTQSGNHVCTQSVEITSNGNGQAPKVVRHSSGDCTAANPGSSVLFQNRPFHDEHMMAIKGEAPDILASQPHI